MTFDQLSDEAKERARARERDHALDYGWWEYTYEDAVCMGALMGIEIDERARRGAGGREIKEYEISFSGFCSQGDGACFEGRYRCAPDAVSAIQAETSDEELLRIAQELTAVQVASKLQGTGGITVTITTGGYYAHSGTMNATVSFDSDDTPDADQYNAVEDRVLQLMRDFADWIYRSLEQEADYLTSDECIDERLVDETFDEDGDII